VSDTEQSPPRVKRIAPWKPGELLDKIVKEGCPPHFKTVYRAWSYFWSLSIGGAIVVLFTWTTKGLSGYDFDFLAGFTTCAFLVALWPPVTAITMHYRIRRRRFWHSLLKPREDGPQNGATS
jgi:hypothetical protein